MNKIDWARKLTSRKMWAAVASFISMLVVALGYAESQGAQIAALIMAGASVIAYIIGEGLVDASNAVPLDGFEIIHDAEVTEEINE